MDIGPQIAALLERIQQNTINTDANWRSSIVADLAVMSLLIDKEGLDIAQVTKRLEEIHRLLPENFQDENTSKRINVLIDGLKGLYTSSDEQPKPRWNFVVHTNPDPPKKNDPNK